jgi:hypothetical protein
MGLGRGTRLLVVAVAWCAMGSAASGDRLAEIAAGLRAELDPKAAEAFDRIDGTGARLLAARSYLRAGAGLAARWSWTAEEIAAYEQSEEFRSASTEVDAVVLAFEAANPGYTLYVNRKARSLDTQISAWNENPTVRAAAAALEEAARAEVAGPAYAAGADPRSIARFREFLLGWRPAPRPNLAAPGLSPHGRLRAFDFQVQKQDGPIVARTSVRDAELEWDAPGWTEQLRAAVAVASTHLRGPLESPREPWHYDYVP